MSVTTGNVASGVAFLDEYVPGWADRINLERLDMVSHSWCIVGQLHIEELVRSKQALHDGILYPSSFGFDVPGGTDQGYPELILAWRQVILARRGLTQAAVAS